MGETDQLPWGSVWIIDGSTRGEEKIVQKIEAHDKIDSGHQRGRDGGIRGPHHHNCRYVQGQHLHGDLRRACLNRGVQRRGDPELMSTGTKPSRTPSRWA